MSMLLKKSKSALEMSKRFMHTAECDDAGISWCCFMLHQALEFAIKFTFECEGMKHPWGHDIDLLIREARAAGINFSTFDKIIPKASIYNRWESESRYKDSFLGTVKEAEECTSYVQELYNEIECRYTTKSEVSDEVYNWCLDHAPDVVKKLPPRDMLDLMLPLYKQYKGN